MLRYLVLLPYGMHYAYRQSFLVYYVLVLNIETLNLKFTMTLTSTINLPDSPTDGAMATKSHKRKGDTVFIETPANHVVVVDGSDNNNNKELSNEDRMQALKQKLKNLRNQYQSEATGTDSFLVSLKQIGADDDEPMEAMMKQSEQIQVDLDTQIQQAQAACQQESSILAQLSMNLSRLEQNRDKLLQDIDEIDQRQVELQQQIALHQQEASEEIECIDGVEEERKREVPRLKHSISLYASTTGIKWDFLQDDILSGSVVSKRMTCGTTSSIIGPLRKGTLTPWTYENLFLFLYRPSRIDKVLSCFQLTLETMIQWKRQTVYGV